jgi:DNA-binding GntR family transcriptional regulator
LNVPSLVDALHKELQEDILSGRLAGGMPLTEALLATRYSVARQTAKAAMERLVHDGLLRRATNKTARVPVLSAADVRDLFDSRGLFERQVITALCERREVPEAALKAVQTLREIAASPSPRLADVVAADVAFHQALTAALGSPRLDRLYGSLMGEVRLCLAQAQANRPLRPALAADAHAALLDLITAGDEKQALREIDDHLDRARTRLIGYLEQPGATEEP